MWLGHRITNACLRRPFIFPPSACRFVVTNSVNFHKEPLLLKEDCEFLAWLQRKTGLEISSALSVGNSIYGRSLFASKYIQGGDCVLKIPYSAQITPNHILPEIEAFFGDDVSNIARLALVVLTEQKLGQDSEWAPYIGCLRQVGELHSTIFWSKDELEMVCKSSIYQKTINHQAYIEKEFLTVKPAIDHFPQIFEDITFMEFMHAYALVGSRAWGTTKASSLIPFADFLNHDGISESMLLSNEDTEISEVIADRDYSAGEQVFISYGKFSNATLMLDFGFTLSRNIYDQVQIRMSVSQDDPLRTMKLELLHNHCMPTMASANGSDSSGIFFTIKEVKSARGKGRGIPQSLRAFGRVLSATSPQELKDLATEAAQSDGRLARLPLKDKNKEIQAHKILLSEIISRIQEHDASLELLRSLKPHTMCSQLAIRREMAKNLITGELRVLKSASAWLKNYCASQ